MWLGNSRGELTRVKAVRVFSVQIGAHESRLHLIRQPRHRIRLYEDRGRSEESPREIREPMTMRLALHIVASLLWLCAVRGAEPGMADIPASIYRPLFRGEKDTKEVPIAAFQLDVRPVTNGEFLEFVRANPQWQRSRVKRLFADGRYLAHWAGDLDPGNARAAQPVVNVSWFSAKAFAAWRGARLPTTAEWETAAAVGFTVRDGAKDAAFQSEIARWYSTPSPAELPDAGAGRANLFGVRDLHGLVWEWTSDFNSAMVTGDARGDSGLERQLFCGAGSLGAKDTGNFAAFMRFGFRSSLRAGYTVHNLGFRCARDP